MAVDNQTVVYISEQIVILISCALSFLGSLLIIFTYIIWPDLRTTPRTLLVYLSVADLLSAGSYAYGVWSVFESNSVDCVVQGAISTFANTSSFFWTVAIAIYLYILIVKSNQRQADSFVLCFHVIRWVLALDSFSYNQNNNSCINCEMFWLIRFEFGIWSVKYQGQESPDPAMLFLYSSMTRLWIFMRNILPYNTWEFMTLGYFTM